MLGWLATVALAQDLDTDGWPAPLDCDDTSAAVNPGAAEVCGGVDDDCDGLVDDLDPSVSGVPTWYFDGDGDRYGRTPTARTRCVAPNPYTWAAEGGDCDDTRWNVNPGASERCDANDRDEDCDGATDDADPSANGRSRWYADADADGHGVAPAIAFQCDAPPGAVGDSVDCNDADPVVFVRDTWSPDFDADGFVDPSLATVVCDAPGPEWTRDTTEADCDDTSDVVWPGAPEACQDGSDADCDGYDGVCPWWQASVTGRTTGEGFGQDVEVGDADGDGVADLLVTENGGVWLFHGPFAGDRPATAADRQWTTASTSQIDAVLGDFDGDGEHEVLVGDPGLAIGGAYGGAYVLDGTTPSGAGSAGAVVTFTGASWYQSDGEHVASGDVDGDGDDDAWIAAPLRNDFRSQSGLVFLQTFPPPAATIDLQRATSGVVYGDQSGQFLGYLGLLSADLDADGEDDLVFSSSRNGGAIASLYLLRTEPTGVVPASASDAVLTYPTQVEIPDLQGFSAGDLDGDGTNDVAVHTENAGVDVLVVTGTATSGTLASRAWARVSGPVGTATWRDSAIGDLDGDGQADLVVTSPYADLGAEASGAIWLVRGPVTGAVDLATADRLLSGTTPADECGAAVTTADLDADGVVDLAAGCTQWSWGAAPSSLGRVLLALQPL